jgi:hypothetical protein
MQDDSTREAGAKAQEQKKQVVLNLLAFHRSVIGRPETLARAMQTARDLALNGE